MKISARTGCGKRLKAESPQRLFVANCPIGRLATCIATFSTKASRGRIGNRNCPASMPVCRRRAAILHDSPSRRPAAQFGRARNGVPLPLEHCPRAAVNSRANSSLHFSLAWRSVPRVTIYPTLPGTTASSADPDAAAQRAVGRRKHGRSRAGAARWRIPGRKIAQKASAARCGPR